MRKEWGVVEVSKNGKMILTTWDGRKEQIETYHGNTREKTVRELSLMYPRRSTWLGHWGRGKFHIYLGNDVRSQKEACGQTYY